MLRVKMKAICKYYPEKEQISSKKIKPIKFHFILLSKTIPAYVRKGRILEILFKYLREYFQFRQNFENDLFDTRCTRAW